MIHQPFNPAVKILKKKYKQQQKALIFLQELKIKKVLLLLLQRSKKKKCKAQERCKVYNKYTFFYVCIWFVDAFAVII